jgi:O-antigen ligase
MVKVNSNKLIIYFAVVISLIFMPMNIDALIIPKIALTFALALYLLPEFFLNIKKLSLNRYSFLLLVSLLIVFQMLVVMFVSKAPLEQEFFGRTGRGLGFATFFSLLIILLCMTIYSQVSDSEFILKWLAISGLISSVYALMQRQGIDIVNWNSRTNGVIGTLGNPNFQSSFTAMAVIPMIIYAWSSYSKFKYILVSFTTLIFLATLYFAQSTQGYIALASALLAFLLVNTWYRKKAIFYLLTTSGIIVGSFAVAGMLDKGPLSYFLYKVSVQSRGDFWRAAFQAANSNPIFGTGIDSFGDSFLVYRDRPKVEMTDNAHNYFLEFAATGGYPLATLYMLIILFTFYSFFSLQRKVGKFDIRLVGMFSSWLVFLLQAIISPGSITLLFWGVILSGYLIASNIKYSANIEKPELNLLTPNSKRKTIAVSLFITGLLIMFPLFKSDYDLKKAASSRDAQILMNALISYPESSKQYNVFTQELLKSGLFPQALEMGRAAATFNPNAVSAWGLIFVNPQAPLAERLMAKEEILRLDPMNNEVFGFDLK